MCNTQIPLTWCHRTPTRTNKHYTTKRQTWTMLNSLMTHHVIKSKKALANCRLSLQSIQSLQSDYTNKIQFTLFPANFVFLLGCHFSKWYLQLKQNVFSNLIVRKVTLWSVKCSERLKIISKYICISNMWTSSSSKRSNK